MLKSLFDVDIARPELLELLGDPLVELIRGNSKLLAPGIVEKRYSRAVFHGALEPVSGHIVAEHLSGDLIVLHERRTCECDVEGVWKGAPLVEG